jgi:hypothetical protein
VRKNGPSGLNKIRDSSQLPHQKQCPLKPEGQEGLLPIISSLKKQGRLVSCSSPYNIPILAVRKGQDKWKLGEDLWLISETVIPLHPIVPNPYTLLV